ncbi:hypothetical protein ACFX11_035233 [Malus domestica]
MNTLDLDIPYQIKLVGNYVLVETNITGLWKTSFALVGVAPLSWDTNLANYAQRYANSRIGDCNLVHSGGPYSENIAKSTGDLSGTAAVNLFVSEKADYNYNSNTCAAGKVCGHYTQVVWRSSTRLGCAKVRCNNGGTFIGCNYDPRGNYAGQRTY